MVFDVADVPGLRRSRARACSSPGSSRLGLRWIKLGKKQFKIHRITGITLAVLVVPHLMQGLYIGFGWFAPVFRAVYG